MSVVALKFPGGRVQFAATPTAAASPAFEVAFVGHCHRGRSQLDRDEAVAALGFNPAADSTGKDEEDGGWYFDKPVPVDSWDQFLDTFGPLAGDHALSLDALPGQRLWLPGAVADFFAAGGKRAWIVRVPLRDNAPEDAHVPPAIAIPGLGPARGLAAACAIPTLGLVVFPDLERMFAIPEVKTPVPPPIPVPLPVFRPQGATPPDTPAGGTYRGPGAIRPSAPVTDVLRRIVRTLSALRPDVSALFALPAGLDSNATSVSVQTEAIRMVYGDGAEKLLPKDKIALPAIQPVVPLLRDAAGSIASPSGLLAGTIAATAEKDGVWRSIAGQPIPCQGTPLRHVGENVIEILRLNGIAALRSAPDGGVVLEVEAAAVPFDDAGRAAPTRRFIGWLHRQLQQYGEGLVFENDPQDGHVEMVLTGFFAELFRLGALKARRLSDAFTVRRAPSPEGAIAFEIRFSPSFAIDTIVLRLVQDADGALAVKAAA